MASRVPARCSLPELRGTLYASDWALAVVRAAFPDRVGLDRGGANGRADCDVVDRGLQEMIGKRINVEFDLGGWRRLVRVDSAVHVYLAATGRGSAKASSGLPIVVGFRRGEGNVLCTSFHNKAQVSEEERRLLRFLVLQPILARAAAEATQAVAARQFQPGQQILSTISRGQTSPPFVFDASAGQSLLYSLNWSGAARLRVTVKNPTGAVHYDRTGNQRPLGCEVVRAAAGRWTCEITGDDLPHDNFPFVLTLATGSAAVVSLAPPGSGLTNKAGVSAAPRGTAAAGLKVPPPPPPRSPARTITRTVPPPTSFKIPPPPPPRTPRAK